MSGTTSPTSGPGVDGAGGGVDPNEVLVQALARLTVRKERPPRIPTFSGRDRTKKEASFEEWMQRVQKVSSRKDEYGLNDQGMEDVVFQSLSGEARSRYMRLDNGTALQEILATMKAVYSDQTSPIDRLQSIHLMSQEKKESVSEFADRLETAAHALAQCDDPIQLDMDKTLKVVFMRGISNREIRVMLEHMRDDPAHTYEHIRAKAVKLEKEQPEVATYPKKVVQPIQSELETTVKKLAAQVDALQKSLAEATAAADVRRMERPPVKCYRCGELGHISRYCKSEKKKMPEASN